MRCVAMERERARLPPLPCCRKGLPLPSRGPCKTSRISLFAPPNWHAKRSRNSRFPTRQTQSKPRFNSPLIIKGEGFALVSAERGEGRFVLLFVAFTF